MHLEEKELFLKLFSQMAYIFDKNVVQGYVVIIIFTQGILCKYTS